MCNLVKALSQIGAVNCSRDPLLLSNITKEAMAQSYICSLMIPSTTEAFISYLIVILCCKNHTSTKNHFVPKIKICLDQ
jgi:hypothetical protein